MVYSFAFCAVVLLDTLCIRFMFPYLLRVRSRVGFGHAFIVTFLSAFIIGIVGLELGGGMLLVPLLQHAGLSQKLAQVLVKNAYLTLAPFLNALALILWTRFIPSLGFHRFWPDAILAGLILDFVDHGIVVPWFFRLAQALR